MLGAADVKMEELDKFVGSRQKFDHCGRQYEEHANGEFTVTMKLPRSEGTFSEERWKLLDDMFTSCHWRDRSGVAKELPCPFQFVVQRKQGQGLS